MSNVLDTDILTLYQFGHPQVVERVTGQNIDELAVTVISVEEQLTGWYAKLRKAKKPDELIRAYQNLAHGVEMLSGFRVFTFTQSSWYRYEQLKAQKINIGKNDLKIAAIALDYDSVLVTRNKSDFSRVPNLQIEDWSK